MKDIVEVISCFKIYYLRIVQFCLSRFFYHFILFFIVFISM